MELAVVPFVGSSRDHGSVHGSPHSNNDHNDDEVTLGEGGVGDGGSGGAHGGFYTPDTVPYGELAPTTVSTERVCPHCLRPYDLYDEDPYADLYDPADPFYRAGRAAPSQARQLPPPPSLTAPSTPQSEQQQQQQQQQPTYLVSASAPTVGFAKTLTAAATGVGKQGGTSLSTTHTRNSTVVHTGGGGGGGGSSYGGSAFPPPAIAFTAHYFRALPPPAAIAAAAAAGTVPLAIEDYHSPDARDDIADEQPMYAAVVAGGLSGSGGGYGYGYSGALVPTRPAVAAATRIIRGSPLACKAPSSPLKLMQSEEEGDENMNEQMLLPGDRERELLDEEEEEQKDRESSPTSPIYSPDAPGPAPSNGYYKHYFKELRQLGRGTYGGVYLCRHLMCGVNLGDFALKKIPVGDKAGYLQKVLREVRILEEVRRHPNVVEYKHSWVEDAQLADFGPPVRCLFILMEYASAGSLDAYLEKYGTHLSTLAVWYFFLSAVAGTAHLHQKHILHRDLKPQNLLLAETKGRPPRVLVSDFGTAAILGDISYERSGGTGTLEYMAPELFEMAASPRGTEERYVNRHTIASDVWSLGMILYYLAFDATLPDRREDGSVVLNTPRLASYGRPPEMMRLMEAMLQLDTTKRPRCSDILGSSFVQSILRTFNHDDPTQWDLLAQQQERVRKGAAGTLATSPPQASLSPRLAQATEAAGAVTNTATAAAVQSGKRDLERKRSGAYASSNRHHITLMSTIAPVLQLRHERQSASSDSAASDENLYSSRVVELQSTTASMELTTPQPANGAIVGDEQQQLRQPLHGRGRLARRFSPVKSRHEVDSQHRDSLSLSRHQQGSQIGTVASPASTPPPLTADKGVQTDPVKIVDDE